MEQKDQIQQKSPLFALFRVALRNIWLIIILVVIGLGAGITFGKLTVKPTYTARCAVMLATSLDPSSQTSNTASTDMSHAKIYLPTVRTTVSAPVTIAKANTIYSGNDIISAYNVSVTVDSDSDTCIFAISYSDSNPESAKNKLESIIEAADIILNEEPVLSAGEANLISLQSEYTLSVSESITKHVFLGLIAGGGIAILIVLMKFAFDNKIKDVEELEEIVGTNILTVIEKNDN